MLKEKQLFLESLKQQITSFPSFVLVDHGSMSAKDAVRLRRSLTMLGEMEVVPKRVFCRALAECGLVFDLDALPGHLAAVFTKGEISPLMKILESQTKGNKAFRFLGSSVSGTVYGIEETVAMGKLPSREILQAQILGLFLSVPSRAVRVMQGALCSILYCMKAQSEKSCATDE